MFAQNAAKPQSKTAAQPANSLTGRSPARPAQRHAPPERTMLPPGLGNQATLRLLAHRSGSHSGSVQTKLKVGQPGDPAEHEADQAAETVVRTLAAAGQPPHPPPVTPAGLSIQRKCEACREEDEEVQRKASGTAPPLHSDTASVHAQLGAGHPLDAHVRLPMEAAFGVDFSPVRIHNDSSGARVSADLNARAFTLGNRIGFAAGEYRPGSQAGDTLLAHELAHVVQQGHAGKQVPAARVRVSPSTAFLQRKEAPGSQVMRIEVYRAAPKPGVKQFDSAVYFLSNGKSYPVQVAESCDSSPGTYRVKVVGRGDDTIFVPITPVPPCRKKSGSYLTFLNKGPGVSEPGSEIEVTIFSPDVGDFFKANEAPAGGVRLDAAARSRISHLLQNAGISKDDWSQIIKSGNQHVRTPEEFIQLLEQRIAAREAENQAALQRAQMLGETLSVSMSLADRQGLDASMGPIYREYRDFQHWESEDLEYDYKKDRLDKELEQYGVLSTADFDARISAFEQSFRAATVNLAFASLKSADRVCERFLLESAKLEHTGGLTTRAKGMIANLEPGRQALVETIDKADEQVNKASKRVTLLDFDQAVISPVQRLAELIDPEGAAPAKAAKDREMQAAQDKLAAAQSVRTKTLDIVGMVLPEFPFISWPDFPKEKLLNATDPGDVTVWINWYLINHRNAIKDSIEQLQSDSRRIYKLDILLGLAKKKFGIADGSIFDLIIADEVQKASEEGPLEAIKSAVLFALMIVSIVVPGGVGVAAAIGSTVLSASQAYDLYKQYYEDLAVHKANLSSLEPSQFWAIAAIIGAGMDAKGAFDLFSKSAALRQAIQDFSENRSVARLSKDLEKVELSPQARHAIEDQAEKNAAKEVPSGSESPEPGTVPADKAPLASANAGEEIASLGPMTGDTAKMLEGNPELRHALAENPLAAQVLKHCSDMCFPENMTALQTRSLEQHLKRLKATGNYDVKSLAEFLYQNRNDLEKAIGDIASKKTSQELDEFLREAGDFRRERLGRIRQRAEEEYEEGTVRNVERTESGEEATNVPPDKAAIKVDPRVRGYGHEDAALASLYPDYRPTPSWFKTIDGFDPATGILGKPKHIGEKTVLVYEHPNVISHKSTTVTDPIALEKKIAGDTGALRSFNGYRLGNVEIEGVGARKLILTFDEEATLGKDTIQVVENWRKNAKGLKFEWYVHRGDEFIPGPEYIKMSGLPDL